MGQHKTNPTAILCKQGLLHPKEKYVRYTQEELIRITAEVLNKKLEEHILSKEEQRRKAIADRVLLGILDEAYYICGLHPLGELRLYSHELQEQAKEPDFLDKVKRISDLQKSWDAAIVTNEEYAKLLKGAKHV